MPVPTPEEALRRLRRLYRDAHHLTNQPVDDEQVLHWATPGPLSSWATHKIRSGGWSYQTVEATVRMVRHLESRACSAVLRKNVAPESPTIQTVETADPFDSIFPIADQRVAE